MSKRRNGECALDIVQRKWKKIAPDFTEFVVWKLNAKWYSDPHNRPRAILVSCARRMVDLVGFPTQPRCHPSVPIKDFLTNYTSQELKDQGINFNKAMLRNLAKVKTFLKKKPSQRGPDRRRWLP